METSDKCTLASLKRGEKAFIKELDLDVVPLKMLELGCLPGSQIEILQKAPFGDPIYACINGVYVTLRKEMAMLIEVEKVIS